MKLPKLKKDPLIEFYKNLVLYTICVISILLLIFLKDLRLIDFIKFAFTNVFLTIIIILNLSLIFEKVSLRKYYKDIEIFEKLVKEEYDCFKINPNVINAIDEFIDIYSQGTIIINSQKIFFISKDKVFSCDMKKVTPLQQGVISKFIKDSYNFKFLTLYGIEYNEFCNKDSIVLMYYKAIKRSAR